MALRLRFALGLAVAWAATPCLALDVWVSHVLDLGADAHALRIDAKRKVIYVSTPVGNRVVFVDLDSFMVQKRVYVGFHPAGLDLSADGNTLYAALNKAGSIAAYDL